MRQGKRAHFVFIPLMAQGHVIPAIDTALLLCAQGPASCSIVATPSTAARVRPCIDSARQSGLDMRLVEFPLEYVADGADNLDSIPAERVVGYFPAVALLRAPIEEYLAEQVPRVTCIVSDMLHPWTSPLADNLGVPRLSFVTMSAFSALCEHNIHAGGTKGQGQQHDDNGSQAQVVVVPGLGLEKKVELMRDQTPSFFRDPCFGTMASEIDRAQARGDGIVINTFLELEPEYVRRLAAAWGQQRVWTVGPVSLHHHHHHHHHQQQSKTAGTGTTTTTTRGDAAADTVTVEHCLRWLDAKEPGSVVYVSFGTMAPRMDPPEQLLELGLGLEISGHPFIWVMSKADEQLSPSLGDSVARLQERVSASGQGRIITGWVPQLLILSHAAVGCVLTHCGWNSILETIAAGKPLVTWPRMVDSDQHLNEKLAVEELGIGLSVWPTPSKEVIQAALTAVLRGGEEGQQRRSRARALSHKATAAMQPGGSSHANLCDLLSRFTPSN